MSRTDIPSQRDRTGCAIIEEMLREHDGELYGSRELVGFDFGMFWRYTNCEFHTSEWKEVKENGNGKEQTCEKELDTRGDKPSP